MSLPFLSTPSTYVRALSIYALCPCPSRMRQVSATVPKHSVGQTLPQVLHLSNGPVQCHNAPHSVRQDALHSLQERATLC